MLPSRIFFDNMLDDFKFEERMKCDIYEKKGVYHIEADIPGFSKDDIKLELNRGNLIITAEKEEKEEEKDKKYIRRERNYYGKYQRSFYLGEVDEKNIEATFNNGILKVSVPKKHEESSKKLISIK